VWVQVIILQINIFFLIIHIFKALILIPYLSKHKKTKTKITPTYEYKSFPSLDDVEEFVHENQLSRRNLTKEKISYHRGKLYNIRKKRWGADAGGRGNQHVVSCQNGNLPKTDSEIANQFNVGVRTIRRDAQSAKAIDALPDEQRKEYLSGKSRDIKKQDLQTVGSAIKDGSYVQAGGIKWTFCLLKIDSFLHPVYM